MIEPIFNNQIQSTMMQFLVKWIEMYMEKMDKADNPANASDQPVAAGNDKSTTSKLSFTGSFDDLIQSASEKYGVDAGLIRAVIQAESNFNPNAVSSAGAEGLMQLMPATANSLGVQNPFDPAQNVEGGVHLLSDLLNRYDGNASLALAAYNAGPGAVAQYGGIPPYQETQTYVQRVLELWN
jgi:soluble lytic murein transglycosylase-like protein